MKYFISTIAILLVSFTSVLGQHKLTRGEVYDFDIGDIFHYRLSGNVQFGLRTIHRHIILSKEYTQNLDGVLYTIEKSGYNVTPDYPNDFIYKFFTDTITLSYSTLNIPIHQPADSIEEVDTIIYSTELLCSDTVYCYNMTNDGAFYNRYYKYGKGLGRTYYKKEAYTPDEIKLVYFKKGNNECGIKDVLGIDDFGDLGGISVFPNPTSSHIWIQVTNEPIEAIYLLDLTGNVILMEMVNSIQYRLDLGFIKPGVYLLKATTNSGEKLAKILLQ